MGVNFTTILGANTIRTLIMDNDSADNAIQQELDHVGELIERAKTGDASAMPELRVLMTKRPAFCQALGNLGANVMVVWIQKHSGENLVQQEAIGRHVDQLRDEISEIGDGPLERIVTQQLLITQVQMCYFSGMIAQAGTEHLPTLRYLSLQLDSTTRRMCYLARNLERLRKGRSARPSAPRNATVTRAPPINHLAELLTA
jgi:hypothetical protein